MSVDSDLSSFDTSSSPGGGGMIAPLLVGFAGVLLGGAALYFSLTGAGATDDAQSNLKQMTAKAEGLETRLADLETKYNEQASQLADAEQKLEQLTNDANGAFKKVGIEITKNRDMIDVSADKLSELIDSLNRSGRPAASAPASTGINTGPAAPAAPTASTPQERLPVATTSQEDTTSLPLASPETRTHTIRSGDTFTKLSDQYNVSVAAILAANPNVDPRRLAVGQKIQIPVE
ncbi:LysM peptidoglycan-binding domain-containing protein [Cerasicoccus frondis]|uniref:LysM peptidoglycan-binding domain-containing protein n=1 Tax=Cerasicoccus frondis TaxID=490090 RepID=UPI002852D6AB|nr:LysM peptidoglycan-binding domain-containing protein [Cerasicoccus frondis]